MNPKEFELAACTAISRYFNDNADVTGVYLSPDDIYTVWSCKTLQNNKGLFTTPVKDGLYYEATYNGDKQELYIDCYQKLKNFAVKVCRIKQQSPYPLSPSGRGLSFLVQAKIS